VGWIPLVRDRGKWWSFVNTVLSRIVWLSGEPLASEEGLCSMELFSLLVSVTFWYGRRKVELIKKNVSEMPWKNTANCMF